MTKVVRFVCVVGRIGTRHYVLPCVRNRAMLPLLGKRVEVTVKEVERQ